MLRLNISKHRPNIPQSSSTPWIETIVDLLKPSAPYHLDPFLGAHKQCFYPDSTAIISVNEYHRYLRCPMAAGQRCGAREHPDCWYVITSPVDVRYHWAVHCSLLTKPSKKRNQLVLPLFVHIFSHYPQLLPGKDAAKSNPDGIITDPDSE